MCPLAGRRCWATMRSMVAYTKAAVERGMQVQEVILRAMAKRITWWQAAEIIGISDRSMRRYTPATLWLGAPGWRERYEQHGYDGLMDRRRGMPSGKRVPLAQVEQVLGLYRERYFDLNVRHFHEKLAVEYGIGLGYTRRVDGNCCPPATCMPSLLCRGNCPPSPCRTSASSTTCSFTPAPRRCLRLLATLGILVPRSVSSACSTAGTSACSFIRMSTAWLPPAASRRITPSGSPPGIPSFCPSACSAASSAASSSPDSATHSIEAHSSSTATSCLLPSRAPLLHG